MAASSILTATTGTGNSSTLEVVEGREMTLILFATSGLTAGENADVQISHDGGTTWQDLYVDGAQVRMHSTNVAVTIYGPGVFRVQKETSTNAAGIWVSADLNL